MLAALPAADMQFNGFGIFAALLGLCFGSFAGVVCKRTVEGESIISPPSYCPNCGDRLKWRDMIPIMGWLLLRGRCRYCKAAVSFRYPVLEAASAVLFVSMAKHTGIQLSVLSLWGLAFVLLCVAAIDWDTMEIPDGLLVVGVVCGVAWVLLNDAGHNWIDALFGAAAGALPLFLLDRLVWIFAKKPGFGFGDVKLMAVVGLFLGPMGIPAAYFIAFVAGGVYGAILLITGRAQRGSYLPFGPFLCLGVLVSFLSLYSQVWFA